MTEISSSSHRLRSLASPLHTWRGLPNVAKFALYTRVSVQGIPVLLAATFMFGWLNQEFMAAVPWWLSIAGSCYLVAVLAVSVAVSELHPDWNVRPRRPVEPLFWSGLALTAVGLVTSFALQIPTVPGETQVFGVVLGMITVMVLATSYIPWLPYRWVVVGAVSLLSGMIFDAAGGGSMVVWFIPAFFTVTVVLSLWTVRLMKEVERSRELEASLRVTEERLRFAQELHDTMGQHLAAMSIKSELAQKFAERDDPRLMTELGDLRQLAGTTMSEMREVVQGYRAINLATEIDGARALLRDAGVEPVVEGDSFDVPEHARELAAWFVRETATNVLRHADADVVTLSLSPRSVRMTNDGAHGGIGKLGGLGALRRRAEVFGAQLVIEQDADDFTVTLLRGDTE